MNPLRWRSEHIIAVLIFAALGMIGGVWIGYAFAAVSSGAQGFMDFHFWFDNPQHWFSWASIGAAIGAATAYAIVLLKA